MKTSSITRAGMTSLHASHLAHKPLRSTLSRALHAFFQKLGQTQVAIVLSEAGDMEGAKALLEKHAK